MSAAVAPGFADVVVASNPQAEERPTVREIPSFRNREVFMAVAAGKSHSEAAKDFGVTQPRVTQIVQQIREWCAQQIHGDDQDLSEIQRLRLAEGTLKMRLDAWLTMTMDEWRKSCREGAGRPAFIAAATRLALCVAKVEGVDITGKTARLLADQQRQKDTEQRARAAQQPLWADPPKPQPISQSQPQSAVAKPAPAPVCDQPPETGLPQTVPFVNKKNPYGLQGSAGTSDIAQSIQEFLPEAPADKPIPKFLDKKSRKRLRALRRQGARNKSLASAS